MDKHKGEYKKILNRFEKSKERLRVKNTKEIKQFVKKRVLSIGCDVTNTQHSFYSELPFAEELKRKKFQYFQKFLHELSDEYRVDFYFTVENGKFRWL